jgi:hypothetical protein
MLWVNGLTIAALVIAAGTGTIGDLGLDPQVQAWVLWVTNLVLAGINAWLRLRTHEPIEGTRGETKARAAVLR